MLPLLLLLRRSLVLTCICLPALAQQPTPPAPPAPPVLNTTPAAGGTAAVAPTPTAPTLSEIIGRTYSVELVSGTAFIGELTASNADELSFQTKDLGLLVIRRTNIKQITLLTLQQTRRGYDYVGNGSRLFFAPTARNLRRGEGYVQSIDIFLLGANYGLTDNISVGVLVPVLPGLQTFVFAVTPKFSVPAGEKLHLGGGVLYASAFGYGGGIGYGLATYGSADNNVTLGLGYAFAGGEVSSTPVVVVGGATRVGRRISLINETYVVSGGVAGLVGARVAASRVSGSLGLLYVSGLDGGIYPAYAEVAYRFGHIR